MPRALLRSLGLLALAAAVVVVLVFFRDLPRQMIAAVERAGPWGPVLLGVVYVPAAVLLVPGSLLTLGAGAAFGLVVGTVCVSLGSTGGAGAAFLVGRTLARGWVESRVADNPRFQAIDRAVAERGFQIVLLLRLSPVFPYTLLNYALGLTQIPFRSYLLASWVGMLPGTIMYVYLGTATAELVQLGAGATEKSPGQQVLFYSGLVATVAVTIYVTRLARRALREAIPLAETPSAEERRDGA
jgi:uncharacterized membrane protein YdjX (TVP38/TMEM64 family)